MAEYLLDTNHASPLVTVGHPLRKRVMREYRLGHQFYIAVPALTETWFGISIIPRAAQNQAEWNQLSRFISCLTLDETDAKAAASIQLALRQRGRDLKVPDALIAVVALNFDFTLLTTDQDFAPVPGLKTDNWLV